MSIETGQAPEHLIYPEKPFFNYSKRTQESYFFTDDPVKIAAANAVEQKAWDYKNLGDSSENRQYDAQSRLIVAEKHGEVVGAARIFGLGDKVIPALDKMEYDNDIEFTKLVRMYRDGELEEFGILARDHEHSKRKLTARNLYRTAWKEARQRDVRAWLMIMEPERAEDSFVKLGIPFLQVSKIKWYQGGNVAAHLLYFEDAIANITEHKNPFVRRALRKIEEEPLSNSF